MIKMVQKIALYFSSNFLVPTRKLQRNSRPELRSLIICNCFTQARKLANAQTVRAHPCKTKQLLLTPLWSNDYYVKFLQNMGNMILYY